MAEFSELIKNFDKTRDYMRDFYVYGFKSREQFTQRSGRSYDNERRRIECWLGDFINFRTCENGKNVFISVDSSLMSHNPLFAAYRSKSFTKNDITLHFIILDILKNASNLSATQITDIISSEYLCFFDNFENIDSLIVRLKLNEYVKEGILSCTKCGKKTSYSLKEDAINLPPLDHAIMYFSEVSPLGVIGSYILDSLEYKNTFFRFKHHYIMHTLEDIVLIDILPALHDGLKTEITYHSSHSTIPSKSIILPLKILVSVQSGRRYLCAYEYRYKTFKNFRLDYIKSLRVLEKESIFKEHAARLENTLKFSWGTSFRKNSSLEKLQMRLSINEENELYIVNRIEREGRHGTIERLDDGSYLYTIETYDTNEMLPWIRTFIGRIISLECSNKRVVDLFYSDFKEMQRMYE